MSSLTTNSSIAASIQSAYQNAYAGISTEAPVEGSFEGAKVTRLPTQGREGTSMEALPAALNNKDLKAWWGQKLPSEEATTTPLANTTIATQSSAHKARATAANRFIQGFNPTEANSEGNKALTRAVIKTRLEAQSFASGKIDKASGAKTAVSLSDPTDKQVEDMINAVVNEMNDAQHDVEQSTPDNGFGSTKFLDTIGALRAEGSTAAEKEKNITGYLNDIEGKLKTATNPFQKAYYGIAKSYYGREQRVAAAERVCIQEKLTGHVMTSVLRKIDTEAIGECVKKRDEVLNGTKKDNIVLVEEDSSALNKSYTKNWSPFKNWTYRGHFDSCSASLKTAVAQANRYHSLIEEEQGKIKGNGALPTNAVENSFAYLSCMTAYAEAQTKFCEAQTALIKIANNPNDDSLKEAANTALQTAQGALQKADTMKRVGRG